MSIELPPCSPRSVHSEPAKFSPSQSPVSSQNSADMERSISNTILNLRPVMKEDSDAKSEEGNREAAQMGGPLGKCTLYGL